MTLSRLRALKRDPEKEQECVKVIRTFFAHGWAEEVDRIPGPPGRTWYLPYHAFYKDDQGERKCWTWYVSCSTVLRIGTDSLTQD
ncbi:hypothetical protein T12_11587 [Trichinella patagoniensis]|uniref:Uncharacterized protein n=1 Tax=Trichinella patagoniensis TaxID=990121 RepID=A0A0V1A9N0_9BILA|nr:hypothetical protein T12_11587 [Trichinella patagoniensis]